MPRVERVDVGDHIFHVLNRASAKARIFDNDRKSEEGALERSEEKNIPFDDSSWVDKMVKKFKLEQTLRGTGRPKGSKNRKYGG
jgi:hypothetical protein